MNSIFTRSIAASLALSALAAAQTSLVLPAEYDVAWGRGSSTALGSNTTRTQSIFANPFPIGTPVFGVGLRPTAGVVDRAAFTADIEVQMSSTPNAPGALSSTFAANVGTDVVVALPRQMVSIPAMRANRSTGEFAQFMFPTPFIFGTNGETNINFDLFVYGRSTGASWSTDRAFAATAGRASTAGLSCGTATVSSSSTNSGGGAYVAGETVTVTLANATPNSGAFLLPSFNMKELVPGVPLPFDLGLIGAGVGCELLVNPQLGSVSLVTDAAGAASFSFPVGGLNQIGTGWQWIYQVAPSGTNPLGLETSQNRAIWLGPEVVGPSAQYVWNLSSVTSATGTSTTDSVPVVQFMIP